MARVSSWVEGFLFRQSESQPLYFLFTLPLSYLRAHAQPASDTLGAVFFEKGMPAPNFCM